jgi:hypothetical protein
LAAATLGVALLAAALALAGGAADPLATGVEADTIGRRASAPLAVPDGRRDGSQQTNSSATNAEHRAACMGVIYHRYNAWSTDSPSQLGARLTSGSSC